MKPKVKITITEANRLQELLNYISNGKSFAPNELKTFR